jgi:hypothetical protein
VKHSNSKDTIPSPTSSSGQRVRAMGALSGWLLGLGGAISLCAAACIASPDYENQYTEQPVRSDQTAVAVPDIVQTSSTDDCDGGASDGSPSSCVTTQSTPDPATSNPPPEPWVSADPPPRKGGTVAAHRRE